MPEPRAANPKSLEKQPPSRGRRHGAEWSDILLDGSWAHAQDHKQLEIIRDGAVMGSNGRWVPMERVSHGIISFKGVKARVFDTQIQWEDGDTWVRMMPVTQAQERSDAAVPSGNVSKFAARAGASFAAPHPGASSEEAPRPGAPPRPAQPPPPPAKSAPSSRPEEGGPPKGGPPPAWPPRPEDVLKRIQGCWTHKGESSAGRRPVETIQGGFVLNIQGAQTPITVSAEGHVCMHVAGQDAAQAVLEGWKKWAADELRWSDGDLWVRWELDLQIVAASGRWRTPSGAVVQLAEGVVFWPDGQMDSFFSLKNCSFVATTKRFGNIEFVLSDDGARLEWKHTNQVWSRDTTPLRLNGRWVHEHDPTAIEMIRDFRLIRAEGEISIHEEPGDRVMMLVEGQAHVGELGANRIRWDRGGPWLRLPDLVSGDEHDPKKREAPTPGAAPEAEAAGPPAEAAQDALDLDGTWDDKNGGVAVVKDGKLLVTGDEGGKGLKIKFLSARRIQVRINGEKAGAKVKSSLKKIAWDDGDVWIRRDPKPADPGPAAEASPSAQSEPSAQASPGGAPEEPENPYESATREAKSALELAKQAFEPKASGQEGKARPAADFERVDSDAEEESENVHMQEMITRMRKKRSEVDPEPEKAAAPIEAPMASPPEAARTSIEGLWMHKGLLTVEEVRGGKLLLPDGGDMTIRASIHGKVHAQFQTANLFGSIEGDELRWSDGDVWVKMPEGRHDDKFAGSWRVPWSGHAVGITANGKVYWPQDCPQNRTVTNCVAFDANTIYMKTPFGQLEEVACGTRNFNTIAFPDGDAWARTSRTFMPPEEKEEGQKEKNEDKKDKKEKKERREKKERKEDKEASLSRPAEEEAQKGEMKRNSKKEEEEEKSEAPLREDARGERHAPKAGPVSLGSAGSEARAPCVFDVGDVAEVCVEDAWLLCIVTGLDPPHAVLTGAYSAQVLPGPGRQSGHCGETLSGLEPGALRRPGASGPAAPAEDSKAAQMLLAAVQIAKRATEEATNAAAKAVNEETLRDLLTKARNTAAEVAVMSATVLQGTGVKKMKAIAQDAKDSLKAMIEKAASADKQIEDLGGSKEGPEAAAASLNGSWVHQYDTSAVERLVDGVAHGASGASCAFTYGNSKIVLLRPDGREEGTVIDNRLILWSDGDTWIRVEAHADLAKADAGLAEADDRLAEADDQASEAHLRDVRKRLEVLQLGLKAEKVGMEKVEKVEKVETLSPDSLVARQALELKMAKLQVSLQADRRQTPVEADLPAAEAQAPPPAKPPPTAGDLAAATKDAAVAAATPQSDLLQKMAEFRESLKAAERAASAPPQKPVVEQGLQRPARVGDRVVSRSGVHVTSESFDGKVWTLNHGENAEVSEIDEDGDFRLRNPGGAESIWQFARHFVIVADSPSASSESRPTVGAYMVSKEFKMSIADNAAGETEAWALKEGEKALVVEVDEDGDVRLKNADGMESDWQFAKAYRLLAP